MTRRGIYLSFYAVLEEINVGVITTKELAIQSKRQSSRFAKFQIMDYPDVSL